MIYLLGSMSDGIAGIYSRGRLIMAVYDIRRRSRTRTVATNETGTSAGCGVSHGPALSTNRHSGQLARAAGAIIVAALLTATAQPAQAELIGFEPPAYTVGLPPAAWIADSSAYCQVTSAQPASGVQCLALGRAGTLWAEAYYRVSPQTSVPQWSIAIKCRPDSYEPSLSDISYRLGSVGTQSQSIERSISVDFELQKYAGSLAKASSWKICVTNALGERSTIGTFLPGQYHDVSLQWNWISRTISVSVLRPDGVSYQFTTPATTGPPAYLFLDGSNRAGLLARYDELAIGELPREPGDANADGVVDVGDLGILGANYGRASGATWATADFTGDGAVDVGDLGVLGANYGHRATGLSPVPEPATLLFLAISGPALCRRRK